MENSFEERFASLEHQNYLMYLQLNAITKLLTDNGFLVKEQIGALMDSMHEEIEVSVNEIEKEEEEKKKGAGHAFR